MVEPSDASSPVPWPPIIYGSAALAAAILTWFGPPWNFGGTGVTAIRILGGILILSAVALIMLAGGQFHKAGTPVPPIEPTSIIVSTGVYRYSRNPMYLGMSLMMLGLAFVTTSLWFLVATPLAMVAVTKLAIEREEAYLERKFGRGYLDYKERVRRWL
jgi:protein-S-isoprenylcysteine O-methyltransferase Ste14